MFKIKKLIPILMILFLIFSIIQPVFATSGVGTWTGGQYASGFCTTDSKNSDGILIRRLTNINTGERKTVFCAEHGIPFTTGKNYTGNYYTVTDNNMKKVCKIAYFGWYKANQDYVVDGGILDDSWAYDVRLSYVYTQQYIWETLEQSNATFINSNIQDGYVNFKNDINNQINAISQRPSFDSTTINIQAGDTKTITDSNGVLSEYNSVDKTKDGVRITHSKGSNDINISVDENTNIENYSLSDATSRDWGFYKEGTEDLDSNIFFEFDDGIQNQLYALNYNDPVTLKLRLNIELFGKLELQKLDTTGALIDGAIYNVSNSNGYNQDITVTNGKIIIEKLKKGSYKIKEKKAPTGYLIDKNTYSIDVKANETSSKAITDLEPTGKISIKKTDIKTGNDNRLDGVAHHGDATLSGAVYTLYASNDVYNVSKTIKYFSKDEEIATFKFDENGVSTISITNRNTKAQLFLDNNSLSGLPLSNYYAKETSSPRGYKVDSSIYNYNLSYKDMNTSIISASGVVSEDVQRAKFEVIKISSNDNSTANTIANAEFTAILTRYVNFYGSFKEALKHTDKYADDEYSIFKTGENGHGTSGLLAFGEYTVEETNTPSDDIETVEPFYININQNSAGVIKEFVENDLPFSSYLKIIKIDNKTGKKVTFSNASFNLLKLNEKNEWEKVSCKLGKNSNDTWTTDDSATAYTETKLSAGTYKIDEIKTPNGFIKPEKEIIFKINRSNKTLEFDQDYDAYITVTVGNEQPNCSLNINKYIALNNNVDKSFVNISDLSGIEFALSAKEDVLDMADGTVIYKAGEKINNYNLSKDGKLKIDNLPLGNYELTEIKTLEGLVLDTKPIEIKFEKVDDTTKQYSKELNIENKATEVEISKNDITGDKELEGAKLSVIDEKGYVVDSWISTDKTHEIEGLLINKTYTLREEIAPDGFVKATDVKFTIKNTGKIQKVTMIDKVVEITKTDITTGKELEGAKLSVTDEKGNVVDSWTSEKTQHIVKGLEEGKKYILTETTCPYGYEKSESITFEVSSDKETQKIVMKDAPILKNIKVQKIDSETKEIVKEKFSFGIFSDSECKNLIQELKSNKDDGYVEFKDLRYGTYYIKEVSAPQGYELSDKVVKVEINDKGTFVDDTQIEEKDNTISLNFEDKLIPTPKTGDNSNIKLAIGIFILSILGLAWIIIKFFKNKKK